MHIRNCQKNWIKTKIGLITSIAATLIGQNCSKLCVCVCVCIRSCRIQSTNPTWQKSSGSSRENLWNIHEEPYTCYQVTKVGILNRDAESMCVRVCVCVFAPAWTRAQTAAASQFSPSSLLGRRQPSTPLSRPDARQSDSPEEGDETVGKVPCAAAESLRSSCMGERVESVPA